MAVCVCVCVGRVESIPSGHCRRSNLEMEPTPKEKQNTAANGLLYKRAPPFRPPFFFFFSFSHLANEETATELNPLPGKKQNQVAKLSTRPTRCV